MIRFKIVPAFLFLVFFCIHTKAQTDSCEVKYEQEKAKFEEKLAQLKETDFSELLKIIYNDDEYKRFITTDRNIILNILLTGKKQATDGNNTPGQCKKFDKNGYYELYDQVWNKENYLYFIQKNKNKIIIPAVNSVIIYNDSTFKDRIKWKTDIGKETTENRVTKHFYYNTGLNFKKVLTIDRDHSNFNTLGIVILPVSYKDKKNCYLVQLQLNVTTSDFKYSTPKVYQYENRSWHFLESY